MYLIVRFMNDDNHLQSSKPENIKTLQLSSDFLVTAEDYLLQETTNGSVLYLFRGYSQQYTYFLQDFLHLGQLEFLYRP